MYHRRSSVEQPTGRHLSYCDYEYFNVLGVYQRFTVIVHGD